MGAAGRFEAVPVLVAGGAGGIGRATARWFTERGAHVVLADRPGDHLARAAAELRLPAVEVDLIDEADVDTAVEAVAGHIGPVEVVVNAAGVTGSGGIEEASVAEWRHVLDVNLTGSFILARAVLPQLRARGRGKIVLLSSVNARTGGSDMSGPAYAAAKAGVESLTRYLARRLAPTVQVNAVAPGPVDTVMLARLDESAIAGLVASIPAGRTADPAEIAATIGFLCSPEADYITGTAVDQNGGQWMR